MTERKPLPTEWVEAGSKALTDGKNYGGWVRQEDAWRAVTTIAEKVIRGVESMIRADEREQRDSYWQGRLESAWVQLDEAGVSLLAARAEVAALREARLCEAHRDDPQAEQSRDDDSCVLCIMLQRDAARAEVAYLVEQRDYWRDVWRAKHDEYTRAQSGWGNQLHLPEDEKP